MFVCICMGLTEEDLHHVLKQNKVLDLDDLMNSTWAGRSCVPFMLDLIRRHRKEESQP